jgi:hypothetical protein
MERYLLQIPIFLFSALFSFSGLSQEQMKGPLKSSLEVILLNQEWKIDQILGLDEDIERYTLTPHYWKKQTKFAGNLAHFTDKGTFYSQYTSWCGNDGFTSLSGDYQFLGDDRIAINVKGVSYYGYLDKPDEHPKMNWMVFSVQQAGDTIIFVKQTEDQQTPVQENKSNK